MAKNVLSLQLLRNSSIFADKNAALTNITAATTNDGTIKLARYTDGEKTKTLFGIYHDFNGQTGGPGYTIYDGDHDAITEIIGRLDAIDGGGSSSGTIDQKIASAVSSLYSTGFTGDGNQVVTAVTEEDGIVAAAGANVGTLTLAGYTEGSESGHVAATDSINAALAKLQNQIDAANDAKDAAIQALNYTDTAVTGNYVSKVDQTDGVISVTREALPTVAAISEAGKPITAVSESLGAISATAGTINAEYVNVADAGNVFTTSTVEGVLAEMDAAYKAADAAIVGDATTEGNTLGKLEDRIEALDADAKEYHIVKTTTGLPETVKERYSLVDADGHVSGETIDIAKDSHIVSITYNGTTQKLTYTYIDASGNTQSTDVDMSELVLETEFGSGVTVTNHVAHGVVDQTSEKDSNNAAFLTVGADGFKVSGIKDEIAKQVGDAVSGLDVADSAVAGQYVSSVSETDGKITVARANVSDAVLNGYAKGTDATAVAATDTVNGAISKLENQIDKAKAAATTKVVEGTDAGNNMTITPATGADGSVTYTVDLADVASKAALDAEIAARKAVDGQTGQTYAANTSANYVSGATSLNDADVKLDSALKAVSDRLTGAATSITDSDQAHISGTVTQADGKITVFTLSENDIASDAELGNVETAVGLNSDGTHVTTSGNYTSGASTIAGEVAALDTQVKANTDNIAALSGASLSGVTVNTKPLSVANNVASITVDGKTSEAAANGNRAIIVETDDNGNLTLGLAYIDAGEY